ncbi:MAG: branched-chain amino acid transaminase [Candidatus Micrarchaeia archaeon]
MQSKQYIWFDGNFVDFEKAHVHVLTHSLQYGSGIFEGIRAYATKDGTAIFRLEDHIKRFINTAKIYMFPLGFSANELSEAIVSTVKKNKLEECYIRPFGFYNDSRIGLDATGKKGSVIIAAVPFGSYFSNRDKGVKCKISSWHRINSSMLPIEAKASGNYLNSLIASLEAKAAGADEAILTSTGGYVAEGPGENIFIVEDGKLITPSRDSDILLGITRDTLIKLAENLGIEFEARNIHKEELYTCDEAFFAGTAAEITPITSIDSRIIGDGKTGPITKLLWSKYSQVVHGEDEEFKEWLTYVK